MGRMIDAWHDLYHNEAPDFECPHCQWDLMMSDPEIQGEQSLELPMLVIDVEAEVARADWDELIYDPDNGNVDRLEDTPNYEGPVSDELRDTLGLKF